jgi:hypothetical protein
MLLAAMHRLQALWPLILPVVMNNGCIKSAVLLFYIHEVGWIPLR